MDDVTWAALTLVLTALGGTWTWYAFRHRGTASGLRAAGITLLPAAAWLTDTLRMFTRIASAVADWATHLVLDPLVWVGIALAGVSVVLLTVAGVLRDRELARGGHEPRSVRRTRRRGNHPATTREAGAPAVGDDDMADIEALLRKRGIS
ncbi:MAG: hypothetical protein ACXVW1_08845 [Nocardioides sp.]